MFVKEINKDEDGVFMSLLKHEKKNGMTSISETFFYDILINIVLINTNVADCDIYVTALLSALVNILNLILSRKVLVKEA